MKRIALMTIAASFVMVTAFMGCQTAKPTVEAAAQSRIETEASGFSPSAEKGMNTISFSILFGNADAVKSWKVEIASGKGIQRTLSGDGTDLPASLSWDGNTDAGAIAPEGTYTALLSLDYAGKYAPATAKSNTFVLDVTPPSVSVTAAPGSFTPTAQGVKESMTLTVDAKSNVAKIDSWTMNVLDPAGKLFKGFSMKWPVDKVTWDGKGLSGDFVQPGQTYTGTLIVRDEYGNVGRSEVDISVAALPEAPQPKGAGPSSVTARRAGFAPTGALATIGLSLSFAQQASVKTWKVEIAQTGQNAQKTLTGTGSNLPATLTWDGKTDAGSLAPEGTYTATLSIDYGTAFKAESVSSAPFVLDLTPPNGSISLSPDLFSPIEATDTLTITLTASSRIAKIDSWTLDIYDPGGHLFESFDGKWPASEIIWDGRGINGDMVVSSEDYPVSVQIRDEFGNVGILKGNIPIDILVVETPQGYRIPNSRVWFKAYTPDYEDVSPDLAAQNDDRLDQLAAKLKKFPDYKYRIVGHAVMIHWDDPARGKIEQEEELIPLSKARAEAIKQALIERGVDGSAITTEGVGASDQIVPDSDLANRWQNRRTAIFIEKE